MPPAKVAAVHNRDSLEYLVSREVFWAASCLLFIHIVYSFIILTVAQWPTSICSAGDMSFPLFFVVFPMWILGHALILRLYERDMESINVFYNCCLGFTIGSLSITLAIWIATTAWLCSSDYFRVAYLDCIIISFCWICIWISAFMKRFMYDESASKNSISYLLLVRCACIPSGVRKLLLVAPMPLSALFYAVKLQNNWNETCHAPLNFFSLTAIVVILLIGSLAYCILVYGRIFVIASSFSAYPEDVSCHPMLMTALWYGAAAVHVFSVVWATIGTIWLNRAGVCSVSIQETASGCIAWLYIFGIVGPILSFFFKIENCFPPASGEATSSRLKCARTNSSLELINPPSTHSISADRDIEMSAADIEVRRGYETQMSKKKRSKKILKPGKYLWNNDNVNVNEGIPTRTRSGDADSLLYPSGTVAADAVHHNPALSSRWILKSEQQNHLGQTVSPIHTHVNATQSPSNTARMPSPYDIPYDNKNLIQAPQSGYSKRMGHLST